MTDKPLTNTWVITTSIKDPLPVPAKGVEELLGDLYRIAVLQRSFDREERRAVASLRDHRVPWSRIGEALGVTAQAAQQRFGKPS